MIIVNYRGPGQARYARISSRADLANCITWLLAILDEMELRGKDKDIVVDLKDYDNEDI